MTSLRPMLLTTLIALIAGCSSGPLPSPADAPDITNTVPAASSSPEPVPTETEPSPGPTATSISVPTPAETLNVIPVTQEGFALASQGGFFMDLLEFVPDIPDTRGIVWLQDLSHFWHELEEAGFERPGSDAPSDWIATIPDSVPLIDVFRARPLLRESPFVCCDMTYFRNSQPYEYVGFDFRSADQTMLVDRGRLRYEAALGRYDAEVTAARLEECAECSSHELVEYGGVTYYSWGEDFQGGIRDRFRPPLHDHAGRGGRLAVGDGYVIRTLRTDVMEDMIDTMSGELPSLMDSEVYETTARALVGLNAFAAGIRAGGLSLDEFRLDCECDTGEISLEDRIEATISEPLLRSFSAAAAGYAFDGPDGSPHVVLVLVHDNNDNAVTNAELLPERLRMEIRLESETGISRNPYFGVGEYVERVEIAIDGAVLLAKIYPNEDAREVTYISLVNILGPGGVLTFE